MSIQKWRLPALILALLLVVTGVASAEADVADAPEKIPVKVLILPKFSFGDVTGTLSGEAYYYYYHYLDGAPSYTVPGAAGDGRLFIRDGVALSLLGMGKVNAALSTMAILSDSRFDFSDAYILSIGCAGSAVENSVMGDVFLITAAVDYDLGHHADIREMSGDPDATTWFHDADFDEAAFIRLNPDLMDRVYALVADLPMQTTERTRDFMSAAFDGAAWATRDPKVLRGTTLTGDNYWKGEYDHANALLMVQTYGCPDPFATTEMEDVAVCTAAKRMGMLDRLIVLRDSVNMDVFMLGATPESLWAPDYVVTSMSTGDSVETADIFDTAMHNNFVVGQAIIDAILSGKL